MSIELVSIELARKLQAAETARDQLSLEIAAMRQDRQDAAAALEDFAASIPDNIHDPRHIADMARQKAAEIRSKTNGQ